jgi:hypothetical protein
MVISGLTFIYMSYQLARSCCHYKRKLGGKENKSVYSIHAVCMLANLAYLLYEFNTTDRNFIPLMFVMMFLLNISSVWTYFLIDTNSKSGESHMTAMGQRHFRMLLWLLCGLFVAGFFMGTYGIECSKNSPAKGALMMSFF